jgi:hypothetical protein
LVVGSPVDKATVGDPLKTRLGNDVNKELPTLKPSAALKAQPALFAFKGNLIRSRYEGYRGTAEIGRSP